MYGAGDVAKSSIGIHTVYFNKKANKDLLKGFDF